MDKFSKALQDSLHRRGILNNVVEPFSDFIEKGKRAQMGEIRTWGTERYQKTPNGWIPVKQGGTGKAPAQKDEGKTSKTVSKTPSEQQEHYLDKFFDPTDFVSNVLEFNMNNAETASIQQFKGAVAKDPQSRNMGTKDLSERLGVSLQEAEKIYDERRKKMFQEIENNPKKYGLTDDNKNSLREEYYPNGKLKRRINRETGLSETWHDNGQMRMRGTYKNGKLEGLREGWYDNGKLAVRATYKDGKENGLYEEWYDNGQMYMRTTYKDGERDGVFEYWHKNGQRRHRTTYKDGKMNGLYEDWFDNGQMYVRGTYKDGEEDGLFEEWHENGKLKTRATYKDGKQIGPWEDWKKNGQLTSSTTQKDGEKDKKKSLIKASVSSILNTTLEAVLDGAEYSQRDFQDEVDAMVDEFTLKIFEKIK